MLLLHFSISFDFLIYFCLVSVSVRFSPPSLLSINKREPRQGAPWQSVAAAHYPSSGSDPGTCPGLTLSSSSSCVAIGKTCEPSTLVSHPFSPKCLLPCILQEPGWKFQVCKASQLCQKIFAKLQLNVLGEIIRVAIRALVGTTALGGRSSRDPHPFVHHI